MAAQRVLRRFPFNLNLGTDICHVVRIRGILDSSRGARFVEKILNNEERHHPKIRRILVQDQACHDGSMRDPRNDAFFDAAKRAHGETTRSSDAGPSTHEQLQVAATFMAGRYAQPRSSEYDPSSNRLVSVISLAYDQN